MANAYATPEKTAAYMQHLDENHKEIMILREKLNDQRLDMVEYVLAFTKLYSLYEGDPFAQRRLMVNLEFTTKRHQVVTH